MRKHAIHKRTINLCCVVTVARLYGQSNQARKQAQPVTNIRRKGNSQRSKKTDMQSKIHGQSHGHSRSHSHIHIHNQIKYMQVRSVWCLPVCNVTMQGLLPVRSRAFVSLVCVFGHMQLSLVCLCRVGEGGSCQQVK